MPSRPIADFVGTSGQSGVLLAYRLARIIAQNPATSSEGLAGGGPPQN